ncbi:MAG: cyanophycin synthetase, partial [Thermoplasmatales archaeon]
KINGFSTEFEFDLSGRRYSAMIPFPGRHFALHAISAVSVCSHLGISVDEAISMLDSYQGLTRRMDLLKREPLVISDYAHHPAEIKTVLESVRQVNESLKEKRRLVVFYQPHRVSRIRLTLENHQDVFLGCDKVYILPIYEPVSAANPPCETETKKLGLRLCELVKSSNVSYTEDFEDQLEHELANPQNTIVILGAGDIDERARRVCT